MEKRKSRKAFSGLLLVEKPYEMVSKDVSRWVQRHFGRQKLGHVGTLDPLASGVLPVVFGKATRLQDYLLEMDKSYEFDIKFGQATVTLDVEGEVYEEMPHDHVNELELRKIATGLVGAFPQVPPLYSAVKYEGKPLYEYARAGRGDEVPLERFKKDVEIHGLELLKFEEDTATFSVSCSKGTYVRVIADTIARNAGTCGHVTRLVRTKAAGFALEQCYSLEFLTENLDRFEEFLIPLGKIPLQLPKWQAVDDDLVRRLKMGQTMHVDMRFFEDGLEQMGDRRVRIHSIDRMLLLDKDSRSFGIGSASILNSGRMAVQMRRGLS
ncbi:tRNA pseudouridine(55) synthase TruB [Pseudobacteriovorax antillogorgiicola]|uniref:tRNA pseudouridine synthase B n=1 Tax=Pseudobacteriovorax antillogorgiicola TaxID=1513793 RepID=A0A1Y6B7Q7_9BACT|nr:tRNA pseudouridine(55) synthase TruB [Pseudobacteriovorax antillogorgiicola]TCS59396.1 tRNA pseudouridine synthase B [Pseudobacteriovorax antillogorgiicola]SME88670.1 tRNA pseudouridine synthase B [Pseudobacteriovorax antillogorgiicola]